MEEVPSLRKAYAGLIVYHPRQFSYVALKAKLSKTTFNKFLKANLKDSQELPLKPIESKKIMIKKC